MLTEILFLASALVLLVAGTKLARYGEAIAEKTGVSVTWIGLFLVAAVTSLPELFTGLSSILAVGEPDLAAGDVLGSCLFNLLLAGCAGLASSRVATRSNDHDVYRVSSIYVTLMLAAVATGMLASRILGGAPVIGLASAFLAVAYFAAIRQVFQIQSRRAERFDGARRFGGMSQRRVVALFLANSILVIGVATLLPFLAQRLAFERGLAISFVGTALLAAATSLPEVVVVAAAVRNGAPSLALGGLVGSNLFNLVILALDDLAYVRGPLLAALDPSHLGTVGIVALATSAFVLAFPPDRPPRRAPLVALLFAYVGALVLAARPFA